MNHGKLKEFSPFSARRYFSENGQVRPPEHFFYILAFYTTLFLGLSGCATRVVEGDLESRMLEQSIVRRDTDGAVKIINSGALDKLERPADAYGYYLYLAARMNDTNTMSALLDKKADPNHKLNRLDLGKTPLHAAAEMRNVAALRLLLDHGGKVHPPQGSVLTPFDLSVQLIEAPGVVTDMLIVAGAMPRDDGADELACAGTQWAMASYADRHYNKPAAIRHYKKAADWYMKLSEAELGTAKFQKFMNSGFMRSFLFVGSMAVGGAAASTGGYYDTSGSLAVLDPSVANDRKSNIASLKEKGERHAAFSKLCADRAAALSEKPPP